MKPEDFNQHLKTYLKHNEERLIGNLAELVAQPSVSSTSEGVEECCRLIVNKMKQIGMDATIYPVKPHPVIVGSVGQDPKKKTVLVYAHYDVQPQGNVEQWRTPPFEPAIVDGVMYGRGTADNKGPLMAHLSAIEFWLKEYGELPVNVKTIFEGSEESNSEGLPEFLEDHKELLAADMVYFSDGSKNHNDQPIIAMGVKGMLYVELVLTTMTRNVHSQYAPVLPSAAWQMVQLLNKLKTEDGFVHIPGFYDDVVPPTEAEREIYASLPDVGEDLLKSYGTYPVYPEDKGYYVQLNGTPSFNISGLSSGYTGEGTATVLTAKATAKIDMRLVARQDGAKILQNLKQYIKDLGYDNVEVICHGITEPAKTPVDTPYLKPVKEAVKKVFGPYMVYPNRPSTAPDYLWTNILGLPTIQVRWCDPTSDNHAPNEHLTLSNYIRGTQLTAMVFKEIGEMRGEAL